MTLICNESSLVMRAHKIGIVESELTDLFVLKYTGPDPIHRQQYRDPKLDDSLCKVNRGRIPLL